MAILSIRGLVVGLQLLSVAASAAIDLTTRSIASDLQGLVGRSSVKIQVRERWNLVDAPEVLVAVSPVCESDVKAVIKYVVAKKLPLVPQSGGNGWAFFSQNGPAVLLNLAGLNQVSVSADKQSALIGGGAIVSDVVAAADAAGVLIMTANCNCLGALGAGLGGGFGNLVGEYGMAVDNVISLRVITPKGEAIDVSRTSHPDLFWAMRGAAANFGIVTYAKVKAVPTTDRTSWIFSMTFDGSRITEVAQAIQGMPLLPNQVVFFILANSGDANNTPTVLLTGFLRQGNETSGRKAFAPLFDLGPNTNSSAVTPYTGWNKANDFFCARGDRKPAYHTSLHSMTSPDWDAVWDLYADFQQKPTAQNTAVLVEVYNYEKAKSVGRGATAVSDELRFNSFAQAVVIPWYTDASLDDTAFAFASKVRDIWAYPYNAKTNNAYINFAHGDEELTAIYGSSLPRLQALKKKYDPGNLLVHWFSLA
ncbi:hypothetical protein NLU13_5187 [Sarocladium strictum]|uniref:FAD-binding PCMH-type domain-containing protein n=1 Tax=Sarocladium strictum TaxID=5046 RepID=A0AA39GI03_SARSR|nr:hypothetical protein NLU13_5187 [Sarocladium strictum]